MSLLGLGLGLGSFGFTGDFNHMSLFWIHTIISFTFVSSNYARK